MYFCGDQVSQQTHHNIPLCVVVMPPCSFAICNHSCPHSKEAMMKKSKRAEALQLCYIFPYPPSTGIENHVNNASFHPLCNNDCKAQNGSKFVNARSDNLELQYWLPVLLSHTACPPGYNSYNQSRHRTITLPGYWVEEQQDTGSHLSLDKENNGNEYLYKWIITTFI